METFKNGDRVSHMLYGYGTVYDHNEGLRLVRVASDTGKVFTVHPVSLTRIADIVYFITIGGGVKLGIVHKSHADAEATAKRLKFRYYEVIPYRTKIQVTKTA